MENTNKSEAHGLLGEMPNALRELWIEIPGDCHLNCSYCLAFENKNDFKFVNRTRLDKRNNLLKVEDYLKIIREFKDGFLLTEKEIADGVKKQIAIPAAGEPFFTQRMRDLVYPIIYFCEENEIIISIFSTGDLINEDDLYKLQPLKNLRLLIKFNSSRDEVQDKLVGKRGYTQARNKSLDRLIELGFNDGRLGIVTSLMRNNVGEAEKILRFARENNITLDMDFVISRGRGGACHCQLERNEEMYKLVDTLCSIDAREYGRHWVPNSTYIGSKPCTRFSYHLYIQNNGDVSPCIGSAQVVYGNINNLSLENIWEGKISKTVRERMSNIKGSCAKCKNFGSSCFSCLGRSAVNLSESLNNGCLNTVGCNIFGPIM